jgi:hypothetical protein
MLVSVSSISRQPKKTNKKPQIMNTKTSKTNSVFDEIRKRKAFALGLPLKGLLVAGLLVATVFSARAQSLQTYFDFTTYGTQSGGASLVDQTGNTTGTLNTDAHTSLTISSDGSSLTTGFRRKFRYKRVERLERDANKIALAANRAAAKPTPQQNIIQGDDGAQWHKSVELMKNIHLCHRPISYGAEFAVVEHFPARGTNEILPRQQNLWVDSSGSGSRPNV